VLNILEQTGLPPNLLELEVTETALMDNLAETRIALQDLRTRGVSIAMDDFGTGYSSLSHLRHLVVDVLKIDRSFVCDVVKDRRDGAMVSSIISMAKLMGMKVIAEGVETEEQLAYLKKRHCDMAQGYLLGRPMPTQEATELLHGQKETGDETARIKVRPAKLAERASDETARIKVLPAELAERAGDETARIKVLPAELAERAGDETARIKVLPAELAGRAGEAREEDEAAKWADQPAAVD
jgi:hypothetical protein